jgi:outer membrane murein-binding lipoprotein Lpp
MKLKDYDLHKSGVHSTPKAIKDTTTFKEVENFENKLMRANQKLNELSSNNTKLRHKINQLRKEKNAMGDIYTKLKKELESKKENVDKTIKFAG